MMLILTQFIGLSFAAYITCGLIGLLFVYAVIYNIKNKKLKKVILNFINNPAFVGSLFQ